MDDMVLPTASFTDEQTECLKKLVLWDTANVVELFDCECLLKEFLPSIGHQIRIPKDMPPFERYLFCSEILSKVLEAEDGKINESVV